MTETSTKFKMWFDEDNKIFRCVIIGDQTEKDAHEMFEQIWQLIDQVVKEGGKVEKIDVLNDVSRAGKIGKKAREINATFFKNIQVNKVAIMGANTFRRTMINIIYRLAGFKNVKFFNNEKQAIAWLKQW
jgi:hypothetical protein